MKISNKIVYAAFISVIVLLIGALVFSVFTINKKNDYIKKVETQNSQNAAEITEKNTHNADLESQLEESRKEKESLNSQLEESKKEKEKLDSELEKSKKETDKLKKEIATLKAKRKAEAEAKAALNAASSSPSSSSPPSSAPNVSVAPNNSAKVCYLTFDDGPSNNTLRILEILRQYNIKATFFVVNDHAILDYVRNIHAEGHAIGLHSYTHDYAKIYSSTDAYFQDLNQLSEAVKNLTGIVPNIIRFPGGGSNTVSKQYCRGIMSQLAKMTAEKGYYYFDWNVSSGDANKNGLSYTQILNNVLKGAKGKKNACVLMHDSATKTTTVDALPYIIEGLIEQGYSFASLSSEAPVFKHGIAN